MAYSAANLNDLRKDLFDLVNRRVAHGSPATSAIATADAASLSQAVALANEIKTTLNTHFGEAMTNGAGAHYAEDTDNVITAPDATYAAGSGLGETESGLPVLLSAIRGALGRHAARLDLHYAEIGGTYGSKVHSGHAELIRETNLAKAAVNAHMASALTAAAAT